MTTATPHFASLVDQLANVRRWNEEREWGFSDFDLDTVDVRPRATDSPLVVDLLAVHLPGDEEHKVNGVQRTCEELWDIAVQRQPRAWCWDERKEGPKPVRLLEGVQHRPGIRRVTLDLGAHWDRRCGVRPLDVRSGSSAAAEILAAAAHFPEWVRAMDGERVPFVCLAGYQVTVPAYEAWRHVICLSWSYFHRRVNLSDNWGDYYQDRFASPVLVGAPLSSTAPSP